MKNIEDTIKGKNKIQSTDPIRFPTGCTLLDLIVGGGQEGFPGGKIINLVGDKSSGKTFLALETIAASRYKMKKIKWIYDDCESGFSFNSTELYGFEIMPEALEERIHSETVEDLYCNVRSFLESLNKEEKGIYVVDSLDGLTSEDDDDFADKRYSAFQKGKDFKEGSYKMGKAKYLSQEFFPQLAELIEEKNALLIIISQVRENIGSLSFEKYKRAGGKAMDFYCHTVLWLANVRKIKVNDRAIGIVIKAKTTKSKTARPYREGFINVFFNYGVDNTSTNLDFLFDWLTDTGMVSTGAKGRWNGEKETNLANLKEFLISHNKEEYYRTKVHKTLKKSELIDWIEDQEDLKTDYESTFGSSMTRNELIEFIEAHHLQKELSIRVIDKWESIETSIKPVREPKYL